MKKQSIASLIFIFCHLATTCYCTPQTIDELQEKIEQVLQETNTPGASIAIVHRDGPEWIAGLGIADVVSGRAVTKETLFRIGSTSKAFTSLAILLLVEQGKLSLEDPVHELVPEVWFENRWEATDPVRVAHLLEHTTGWDDMHFREYANDGLNISLSEAFDYHHKSRICRWPPGTRMAYCNSGPAVAAYIVEKITGEKFEDYVEKNLLQPIGMNTATYFQPPAESTTILYHNDGITPYDYWNLIYRPSGSMNASASNMANYLLFYLNRGSINGMQILPPAAIDRMEVPKTTWAAEEGLKTGYGLSNYWTINNGFVYHGHDGTVEGGRTVLGYMPDQDVGYFYSINSASRDAFDKIGEMIRGYITRNLQKPSLPPIAPLPSNAADYTGWYEPDSPRLFLTNFLERLLGLAHVHFEDNKLLISSLGQKNTLYLPVIDSHFRYVPEDKPAEPIPTVSLLSPHAKGRFIQVGLGMSTMKRIPSWLAIGEIAALGFVLLSIGLILVYAPFWIIGGLMKKRRRPLERSMRLYPLIAVISLIAIVAITIMSSDDLIYRLGNITAWSVSLFLATILFAAASAASVIAVWRAPKQQVRRYVRIYSMIVTTALVITTAYLAYWGVIGLRTWA